MKPAATSIRASWTAAQSLGRSFVEAVGPAFEAITNICFLPGVYLRMAIRGVVFRIAGVPIGFGPATSSQARGTYSSHEQTTVLASKALVRSCAIQTTIGLAILMPEILRQALLDTPMFPPSYGDDTLLEFVIDRWIRDWPQGLTVWFGISAILLAPLNSTEWATVLQAGPPRPPLVQGVFTTLARFTRTLEPLDALGRLSVGAIWTVGSVWLLARAVHVASEMLI